MGAMEAFNPQSVSSRAPHLPGHPLPSASAPSPALHGAAERSSVEPAGGAQPVNPESSYVGWMRARQLEEHRHAPVLAQRCATADQSEGPDVHAQDVAWAERHAHERRLHDSALAHLRHG